jgi:hypothetical protein
MTELRTLGFGILDIQEVRQDLEDWQAMNVLIYIKTWLDYKNGLTDEEIQEVANELYPESKS